MMGVLMDANVNCGVMTRASTSRESEVNIAMTVCSEEQGMWLIAIQHYFTLLAYDCWSFFLLDEQHW